MNQTLYGVRRRVDGQMFVEWRYHPRTQRWVPKWNTEKFRLVGSAIGAAGIRDEIAEFTGKRETCDVVPVAIGEPIFTKP